MFHVSDAVWDKDRKIVHAHLMKPISRLGGAQYGVLASVFEIPRPKV